MSSSSNTKKNIDNARRFLWDEDEPPTMTSAATSGTSRSRAAAASAAAQSRGAGAFSTRDYAVDQSVNLMDMDDQPLDSRSGHHHGATAGGGGGSSRFGGSIAGLFRATAGAPTSSQQQQRHFSEYGDAAPSADAEEYISDKQRRITPVGVMLANALDSCALLFGRFGLHGVRLMVCLGVGLGLVVVGLYFGVSGGSGSSSVSKTTSSIDTTDARMNEILQRILDVTSQLVLEDTSSPERSALEWLAHDDPAKLNADDPALVDRYSLAVFYYNSPNAAKDPIAGGWINSENWMTGIGICAWFGIECPPREQEATEENNFTPFTKTYDDNARITGIFLKENNIEGEIPEVWGRALGELATLDLQSNQIRHVLPPSLGNLAQLRNLLLRENMLSGFLPTEYGYMTNLHQLNLGKNSLEGSIPPSWSNMKELRMFSVEENLLTGTFPNIENMKKLMGLFLDNNDFEGTIPTSLKTLTDLLDFRISKNRFSGDISMLQSCKNIETIHIAENEFTGTIPNMFDYIFRLHELSAYSNSLTGPIPVTITHLQGMKTLILANNKLSGSVPNGLGSLTDVITIDLSNNQLSGQLPTFLGILDDITNLNLSQNAITGTIPSELGLCFRLKELYLNNNQLEGEIPTHLGQLNDLEKLHLEGNLLDGVSMPPEVCTLREDDLSKLVADCKVNCDCCTQCEK